MSVDEQFRDLVHQRNKIEILEESDDRNIVPIEIHSGRAGGIIDHAVGLLMAPPSFHVEPENLTTESAREAEQLERACAMLFQQQLLGNDFWPSIGRDILIYGRSYMKSTMLTSLWTAQEGYPVRNQKENDKQYLMRIREWKDSEGKFPYVMTHIPAMAILPLLDNNDNVIATIEEKWVTAKILADEMNSEEVKTLLERHALEWYDELPVIEYTDNEWVAYLLVGTQPRDRSVTSSALMMDHSMRSGGGYKLLRTWQHKLGVHPVTLFPGIRTELPELESHFKSFLFDAKDALELYDFLLSRLATMVNAFYLPSYVWKISATAAQFQGREPPTKTIVLGGVTPIYADEELEVLPQPPQLFDATALIQQVDDIIQRHTLEDVLFGRVPGAAPAFQVRLRINVARSKLTPIAAHMAQSLTNVIRTFLRAVESLGEAVVINGERVTKSTATKYKNRVTVSIQPKDLTGRNQDISLANMALQFGLPWDWIVENILDIEDPATLRLQKDILEIEQLPQVKEKLTADALDQLDLLVEEDEFMDVGNIDLDSLPPEVAQALQNLSGETAPATDASDIEALISGSMGNTANPGLGRGPYPDGAAPQSLQGGRGLNTERTPPPMNSPPVSSADLGMAGGELTSY